MADPEQGNPPNGRGPESAGSDGAAPAAEGEPEANLTLSDGDQTLADLDQTTADSDQTAADGDEAAAASDQAAADDDQAASDRDFAAGGNPEVHGSSRHVREQSARQRRDGNRTRSESALNRDSVAAARDLAAVARDEAAAMLDRELDERDAAWAVDQTDTGSAPEARAKVNRERAAADRALAAEARDRAAADRDQAAADRAAAAVDRRRSHEDREALLQELAASELDALTGARTRGPGLVDLDNEIDRARRTADGMLAVAYVDVVGLKKVNDEQGHSAGDILLRESVRAIRAHLRSYDAIVRVGGDEFLCILSGAEVGVVRERFDSVQATLAAERPGGAIKVGIAALGSDESAIELIGRADSAMQRGG